MSRAGTFAIPILAYSFLGAPGCGPKDKTPTLEGEESRRTVLASIVQNVVLPTHERFAARASELVSALTALVETEQASPEAADLTAARDAWAATMEAWQEAELLLLGPAAQVGRAGGQGLRDKIYSWPVTNPCRVDQETQRGTFTDPATLVEAPANVRGLAALEWLLYAPSTDNACPPQAAVNADGTWAAMGLDGVRVARAEHAEALARRLAADAEALRTAWLPDGGDFARELAEAGLTPTYRSAQEGLNAVSDAMFYLDKETKDTKLALPLGLRDCATGVCPDKTENPLSRRSGAHLLHNLVAFDHLFHGGPDAATGTGFDDLLMALGATELAATMSARIATARAALEALDAPLEELVVTDKPRVQAAYDALRNLTDLLKTELLSVLDLELPERADGDND